MDFSWQKARQPLARELGWSLFSPAVAHFGATASDPRWQPAWDEEARHVLAGVEANPSALARHLAALPDRRLGARFEALWRYFLDNHSFYEVLAANLPLRDSERTLGAIDFLIRDHHLNRVIHLELAVKFYLHHPGGVAGSGLAEWIGPNPDDNLAAKISHLKLKQLPLSNSPATAAILKQRGLPVPDHRVALIRGYLFSPLTARIIPGPMVEPDHLQGRWLYAWQLARLDAVRTKTTFEILAKEAWLDPSPATPKPYAKARRQVLELLATTRQPVMVAARKKSQEGAATRYFVVPDRWPDTIAVAQGDT